MGFHLLLLLFGAAFFGKEKTEGCQRGDGLIAVGGSYDTFAVKRRQKELRIEIFLFAGSAGCGCDCGCGLVWVWWSMWMRMLLASGSLAVRQRSGRSPRRCIPPITSAVQVF